MVRVVKGNKLDWQKLKDFIKKEFQWALMAEGRWVFMPILSRWKEDSNEEHGREGVMKIGWQTNYNGKENCGVLTTRKEIPLKGHICSNFGLFY